jgi:hypothetical protein
MSTIDRVNIYKSGDQWFLSAYSGDEFDCSHEIDDVETEHEARTAVAVIFPAAVINRVEDV